MSLRYWYECPECKLRIWISHPNKQLMTTAKPHCPFCGTSTHRFIDIGLARYAWRRDGWRIRRQLVRANGEEARP